MLIAFSSFRPFLVVCVGFVTGFPILVPSFLSHIPSSVPFAQHAFADGPTVTDPDFVVQQYVTGICCGAVTFAFLNDTDILVLEKASGEVHLIHNGIFNFDPVLKEHVTSIGEQGMLTIATSGKKVYLYFTESLSDNGAALGKRVYSYDWTGSRLVNRTLVKDLPETQTYHNGGAMTFDKNGSLYIAIGDAGRYGKLENHATGEPDDTGVIMRLVPPGQYYAIGLRNSFGLTDDPITGSLWDTENGLDRYDEINLVTPKFNSGWDVIMGPANSTLLAELPGYLDYQYHNPQFSWQKPVAPTGIAFAANSVPFAKYGNSVFVGDFNFGNLYRFTLNSTRTGFVFSDPALADDVANVGDSMDSIVFGRGFNGITDVKFGPDGYLYMMSYNGGTLYRIVPASASNDPALSSNSIQSQLQLAGLITAAAALSGFAAWKFRRNFSKDQQGNRGS